MTSRQVIVRVLRWSAITIVILAALLAGLRLAAGGAPGRWLVTSQLDGREIGGQTIAIEGLSGDPLSRLHLDRLTLADADGVWLTAEDIRLDWQASSLLFKPYRVRSISAARVEVLRRPAGRDDAPDSDGGLPELPALILGELTVAELALAEGVAGPASRLRIDASAEAGAGDGARLHLDAERVDAEGDRLAADLRIDASGIAGTLDAFGAADGPLASLLRLSGRTIHAEGEIAGDGDAGEGDVVLRAGDQEMARARINWTERDWRAEGRVDVEGWGVVPESYRDLAGDADIVAEGSREAGFTFTRLEAETSSGSATLAPAGENAWTVSARAGTGTIAALTSGRVTARTASWSGRVETGGGLRLDGELTAEALAVDYVTADRVSGPVTVVRRDGRYIIESRLDLQSPHLAVEQAAPLIGDTAALDFAGTWDGQARALEIDRLAVETGHARLDASGRYPLGEDDPALDAVLAINDIARLTSRASGPARLTLNAQSWQSAHLGVDAASVVWDPAYADLLRDLEGEVTVARTDDGWQMRDIRARASGVDLSGRGQTRGDGWTAEGDLALSGQLPVEAAQIDGALATAFRVNASEDGRIEIRTATRSNAITAGQLTVTDPNLAIETIWQDGSLTADWILEATRNGKPVRMTGAVTRTGDTWSAHIDESLIGPFRISASAEQTTQRLDAAFDMELGDRARSSIRYSASPEALRDGVLDAELIISGHSFSGGYLAEATLRLDGPLSDMAVRTTATGRLRSPLTLNAAGRLGISEDGAVSLSLSPSGRWSIHRIRTAEPVTLDYADGDYRAGGATTIGDGTLSWRYARTGGQAELEAGLAGLPVTVIADITAFPPAAGMLSGEVRLERIDGVWQGGAALGIDDLAALAADSAQPVDADLVLDVAENARIEMTLTGDDLSGNATLVREGPTPRLAMLAGEDGSPVSGRLRLRGDIADLAALLVPPDARIDGGEMVAEVDLAGVRGAPELAGRLQLSGGQVTATATGATIRDLELAATFDGSGLELTELSASDGESGRLTGSGVLRLPTEGPRGEAELEFDRFQAARRDDMTIQATGNANLSLDARGLLISGAANVDRARIRPSMNGAASIPEIDVQEINLPKGRQSYSRNVLPMRLDYSVEADRNIYIDSSTFSSEWGLDLNASGAVGKPELSGRAMLLDGTAFVFNRRFRLEGGEVRFDGAPEDARVDLTATHERTGFSATARIEGPVRSPSVTLSSDPALPEDEILSRLLFDESVSELGAFEAAQLAAQLSGQSLLNIVGQLRDLAGIDRLSVSTDADGNIAVTGGVRLGDNVYVELGTGGTSALGQALVEWQLTPDLSVLSRLSADTDASVAIRWRRDY